MFPKAHFNAAQDVELNTELFRLAQRLPSTCAGIEALDLISRARANVTNLVFKRETIAYVKKHFQEYLK